MSPWEQVGRLSGRGLLVAVIDSGINAGHPHVGVVRGGASFAVERGEVSVREGDFADRVGHGTACAGAIRELLPDAGLLAARVFGDRLEARAPALAAAIRWAVEQGAAVLNLSLAVDPSSPAAQDILTACQDAARAGAVLVAARPPLGLSPRPDALAGLPEVITAAGDPDCPPDRFRADPETNGFLASPFARPLPGIPRGVNFQGPSLAAARLSGFVGKILEDRGRLPAELLRRLLGEWAGQINQVRC